MRDPVLDREPVATLDLHRLGATEAKVAVQNFLSSWQKRAPGGVVHIVTGKGRRSPSGAVLKPMVRGMLASDLSTLVRDWARDLDDAGYLVLLA
jgi:DNA-nicking Smr family endonuclease